MIDASELFQDDEIRNDLEILEEYLDGVPLPPLEFELVGVGSATGVTTSDPFGEVSGTPEFPPSDRDLPGLAASLPPLPEPEPVEQEEVDEPPPTQTRTITTSTMAEIYVSQGFIQKAIDIYAQMLNDSPGNPAIIRRLDELAAMLLEQEEGERAVPDGVPDIFTSSASPSDEPSDSADEPFQAASSTPTGGGDGRVLETLERWLDNARRRKQWDSRPF